MSLADQIAERNAAPSSAATDEFGIPVPMPETPEYLVARALAINERTLEQTQAPRIHGLHLRGGDVWLGHNPLKQQRDTIYQLTHLRRSLKDWEAQAFWRVLKQYLPHLDRRYLEVADGLLWDTERAILVSNSKEEV